MQTSRPAMFCSAFSGKGQGRWHLCLQPSELPWAMWPLHHQVSRACSSIRESKERPAVFTVLLQTPAPASLERASKEFLAFSQWDNEQDGQISNT